MSISNSRTIIQKNIFLFQAVVLFKVTAYLLKQYFLLPLCRSINFNSLAKIYAREFGTKMLRLSPAIPYVELEEIFPGIGLVLIKTLGKFEYFSTGQVSDAFGSLVSAQELQTLCALVKKVNPKKIFEFGTYQGWTIANLALNATHDCKIFSIDISPVNLGNLEIKETIENFSVELIKGNTTQFDFSPYYGEIDFIFIDGSHNKIDVERDSQAALKMLSKTGIIIWHDHNLEFTGVVDCLHALSRQISIKHIPGTSLAFYYRC